MLQFVPSKRPWAAHKLLSIGYLHNASDVMREYHTQSQTVDGKRLKERIDSMEDIRHNGLSFQSAQKKRPGHTNVLLALHNSLPYDKAGYAIRSHMLATNVVNHGIKLVATTRPGYPWDLKKHREKEKVASNSVDKVEYRRLFDPEKTFKKGSDFNYIDVYSQELIETASSCHATLIHANSNYLNGLAAIQVANELQIPAIYEVRGLWHITRLTLDENYRYQGMFDYEEQMEKAAANGADTVVCISYALKQLLIDWGVEEKKISVIPNAVDVQHFQHRKPSITLRQKYGLEGKVVIGYVGSLTGYEGLRELILAVNELSREGLNIVLMIVGDGREKASLEKVVKSKNIIFTGRVPFEEVEEYYSLFDICPFPRNDYEVCRYVPPLKILEAMAMRKAIIVSDVAPLLEIIEDNVTGLVCQANSVESLKSVISALYEDSEKRKELGANAYNWVVDNRTWDGMSQKYVELYKRLVEKDEVEYSVN